MKKFSSEWWQSLRPEEAGDATEKLVESLFKDWNSSQDFAWHRMPDAKAARGRMAAQPADYIYRKGETCGWLEVKALKHAYRLPNARLTQLPTLLKWELAGHSSLVLVFHYMENVWRWVKPDLIDPSAPSWDLRNFATFNSAEEALKATGYFGD